MRFAKKPLFMILAILVAVLVQVSAWKLGQQIIDPFGWLLYLASITALLFSEKTPFAGSKALHSCLQALFLITFITLYDQNAVLLAMVPPARFEPHEETSPAGGPSCSQARRQFP